MILSLKELNGDRVHQFVEGHRASAKDEYVPKLRRVYMKLEDERRLLIFFV